jgi:hypothetical protein
LAACGGSDGLNRGDAGGPPPTATEFCQEAQAIYIARYMHCYGGEAADWPIFLGPSPCPTLAQEIEKQAVTYDPTKARACLAGIPRQPACDELWPDIPCIAEVLRGTLAEGQRCESSFACSADLVCGSPQGATFQCSTKSCQRIPGVGEPCEFFCQGNASCVDGTCVANLAAGAPCGAAGSAGCAYGFHCADSGAQPTCKKLVQDGPCATSQDCFDHQYCDTARLKCSARVGLGADCSLDPGACESFTACDPTTKRCVAASHPGQLCGNLLGFPSVCDGTCEISEGDAHARCVAARHANGTACTDGTECSSQYCAEGKCASVPSNDGVACEDYTECTSRLCTGGTCVAAGPIGAPCTGGVDCASGVCSAGVCVACP